MTIRTMKLLIGVALIVVGSIQMLTPVYQTLLNPMWQGVLTWAVGVALAVLHYLESQMPDKRADDKLLTDWAQEREALKTQDLSQPKEVP